MVSACASLQSVSFSEMPAQRDHQVTAEASKFMFLFVSFSNSFVDSLPLELQEQCKGGSVQGVMTKHENYSYVLFNRTRVTAKGYCIRKGKV